MDCASSTAGPICSLRELSRTPLGARRENPRKHERSEAPIPSDSRRMLLCSPRKRSERRKLMPRATSKAARTTEKGLVIERRFTTTGVHPYDELEWEKRDAIIGDPQAVGGPAFEQRGVEFPTSWSQNATNIVAQKYFRGQPGSPERETSVKQMVSRVAGRIAQVGRETGYFATDEDGNAFEDELTSILVNQKAAF